jgi:hypothetical protein
MNVRRVVLLLMSIASLTALPLAKAQTLVDPGDSSTTVAGSASATYPLPDLTYMRPTQKTKLRNYVFDAFGPYPIVGAGFAAGINQAENTPPEWKQGAESYAKRFGSDFGIAAVSTTTRYALARAFREDTLYYRCECTGVFPRLRHAIISTFTARRGEDGHRVFSFSDLVAPYAGTMTAYCGMRVQTSALSSSIADPTPCFLACISTMGMERQVQGQIRERLEIQSDCSHGPSTSGAAELTHVPRVELPQDVDQRISRVVRRSGHIFWESSVGCSNAAV